MVFEPLGFSRSAAGEEMGSGSDFSSYSDLDTGNRNSQQGVWVAHEIEIVACLECSPGN